MPLTDDTKDTGDKSTAKQNDEEHQLDFQEIFAQVNQSFSRLSPSADELHDKYMEAIFRSAIAKCLDFNIAANGPIDSKSPIFFLPSNSRSICEELVYCAYFCTIDLREARKIAIAIQNLAIRKSILAQTRFFAKNNSLQPTVGGHRRTSEHRSDISHAEDQLRALLSRHGLGRTVMPRVRTLAHKVGLNTTYEYVYHMSSNFVHFNPNQLLKMGWGPERGPFTFSADNFAGYYSLLSRFLGAIFFLGYCWLFPDKFSDDFSEIFISQVTKRLGSGVRWPEIVMFEEMNQNPPNIILSAVMTVMRAEDGEALPDILSELKSLRK